MLTASRASAAAKAHAGLTGLEMFKWAAGILESHWTCMALLKILSQLPLPGARKLSRGTSGKVVT